MVYRNIKANELAQVENSEKKTFLCGIAQKMFLHIVVFSCLCIALAQDTDVYQFVPQDYLKWNYSHVSPQCISAGGGQNPCKDVRVCNFALASVSMGGWPTLCGWVGKGVPKVCCGLPLVLGGKLMKQVNEEKAKNRACGTRTVLGGSSPTENRFYNILKHIPPPDTSDPHKYDPPLDLTVEKVLIPPTRRKPVSDDFPWMVAVFKGSDLACGGTLIDRNHVLSAASCFEINGLDPDMYTVQVGDLGIVEGYPYSLNEIKVHEKYVPGDLNNNLAILTLSEKVLSPVFPHICLPSPELADVDFAGSKATHLEWTYETVRGERVPKLSVTKAVQVIPMQLCKLAYSKLGMNISSQLGTTDKLLCAGTTDGSGDNCKMNAGGPLMYEMRDQNMSPNHREFTWLQIGVASLGYKCGIPGSPLVYTNVPSFMDWIHKNTKSKIEPQ